LTLIECIAHHLPTLANWRINFHAAEDIRSWNIEQLIY